MKSHRKIFNETQLPIEKFKLEEVIGRPSKLSNDLLFTEFHKKTQKNTNKQKKLFKVSYLISAIFSIVLISNAFAIVTATELETPTQNSENIQDSNLPYILNSELSTANIEKRESSLPINIEHNRDDYEYYLHKKKNDNLGSFISFGHVRHAANPNNDIAPLLKLLLVNEDESQYNLSSERKNYLIDLYSKNSDALPEDYNLSNDDLKYLEFLQKVIDEKLNQVPALRSAASSTPPLMQSTSSVASNGNSNSAAASSSLINSPTFKRILNESHIYLTSLICLIGMLNDNE